MCFWNLVPDLHNWNKQKKRSDEIKPSLLQKFDYKNLPLWHCFEFINFAKTGKRRTWCHPLVIDLTTSWVEDQTVSSLQQLDRVHPPHALSRHSPNWWGSKYQCSKYKRSKYQRSKYQRSKYQWIKMPCLDTHQGSLGQGPSKSGHSLNEWCWW